MTRTPILVRLAISLDVDVPWISSCKFARPSVVLQSKNMSSSSKLVPFCFTYDVFYTISSSKFVAVHRIRE